MPSEVLVFDMDGVLVDVHESYRETIRQTVRHFTGREASHEHIQDLKNAGGLNNDWALSQKIVRDFGVDADYDTVVAYFQSVLLGEGGFMSRERWVPRPGLLEALGRRFRLAIFTGRLREEARLTLDRFAREIVFDPVIGTDDIDNGKPAPDGLFKIAALVNGARLRYVGDTVDDARCARAAAVPFIGIAAQSNPRRAELARLLRAEGALAVLEDVNGLEEAL